MNRPGPPAASSPKPTPPPQPAAPPKARHPAGDRSHIPASAQRLVDILSQDMQRVAVKAPSNFAPQVKDTQKRLNILFDHLNNEELVQPGTIEQLTELAQAIEAKNYDVAHKLQVEVQRDKTEECGNWMVSLYGPVNIVQKLIRILGWCEAPYQHEQGYAVSKCWNTRHVLM